MVIKPDQLHVAVNNLLDEYVKEVQDVVDREGENTARETVKFLKENSPNVEGIYASGWSLAKESQPGAGKKFIVHNKKSWQLTHLLEKGHMTRNPSKPRTKAQPHLGPAEEYASKEFEARIKGNL